MDEVECIVLILFTFVSKKEELITVNIVTYLGN